MESPRLSSCPLCVENGLAQLPVLEVSLKVSSWRANLVPLVFKAEDWFAVRRLLPQQRVRRFAGSEEVFL